MAVTSLQVKMLKRLLQIGSQENIARAVEKIHPSDISSLFSDLADKETLNLINSLYLIPKAGQTLRELPHFLLPDILEQIDNKKLAIILARLEPDDALFLLERVPENRWRTLLEQLPIAQRLRLEPLLLYPKNSAGSVMTSHFLTVNAEMTVEEAIASLRQSPDVKDAFYIYVLDEEKRLVGVQSLRKMVLSEPHKKIRDIMETEVYSVEATTDQEQAAQIVAHYNLLAIPVVNERRELLGVITVDDVIDILKEEATEDIYQMAGLSEEDRAYSPLTLKVKKRLPWMVINLATAFAAAWVVSLFEGTIAKMAVLAAYMPIIAGMGGNGATQSLVVMTRSIALGEIAFSKTWIAVAKEIANGLIVGLVCGLIAGLAAIFLNGKAYLGLIIFLAMTINLIMAGFAGAAVPLLLKKLKLDPATASSIIVTTFTDIVGFFAFLGLATVLMKYLI